MNINGIGASTGISSLIISTRYPDGS